MYRKKKNRTEFTKLLEGERTGCNGSEGTGIVKASAGSLVRGLFRWGGRGGDKRKWQQVGLQRRHSENSEPLCFWTP